MAKKTKDFAEFIRSKLAKNPQLAKDVEDERFDLDVATAISKARISANLTQTELGTLTGMHQSAIARMEDANYDGHTISSLKRIAQSLQKRLSVQFVESSTSMTVKVRSHTLPVELRWADMIEWHPEISQPLIESDFTQDIAA